MDAAISEAHVNLMAPALHQGVVRQGTQGAQLPVSQP
jgi:hypothetical protein